MFCNRNIGTSDLAARQPYASRDRLANPSQANEWQRQPRALSALTDEEMTGAFVRCGEIKRGPSCWPGGRNGKRAALGVLIDRDRERQRLRFTVRYTILAVA